LYTLLAVALIGFIVHQVSGLPLLHALLVVTPFALMIGSAVTLWLLAVQSDAINASRQLYILLVVEFVCVPLGAAVALVTFFVLRDAAN